MSRSEIVSLVSVHGSDCLFGLIKMYQGTSAFYGGNSVSFCYL